MSVLKSLITYIKEARYNPVEIFHGTVYGVFPRTYLRVLDILLKSGSTKFRNHVADTYHAKVLKLDDAARIININHDVIMTDLEHVLPYKNATDIILKNPDNITVVDCPCRGLKKNPCKPIDVCLIVGDPFADNSRMAQPFRSRKISAEEALTILKEEDERGHVHTAWFKSVMLNRFYAICNCCKCCCTGMHSMNAFNMPRIQPSGYRAEISEAQCIGCGACAKYCQFDAIVQVEPSGDPGEDNNKKKQPYTVDADKCFGCAVCESKCKQEAITIVRDPAKGVPLNIEQLAAEN